MSWLASICLLAYMVGILLPLISDWLEKTSWPVIEMKWTVLFSWELLKKRFLISLKSLFSNTKKSRLVVNQVHPITTSIEEFDSMPIITRWRLWARKKYEFVETAYYPVVDDLQQKLADLGEVNEKHIPDFNLYPFSFIKEWQQGFKDTQHVLSILRGMNFDHAAEANLTRRLSNFMIGKENTCPKTCEYVRFSLEKIKMEVIPVYIAYLEFLTKFFERMDEIDSTQVPVTWLEKIFHHNGDVKKTTKDITLNQAFREIKTLVMRNNTHKYFMGKNLVVFNEEMTHNDEALHFIFGPESYITELKTLFKVTEHIPLSEEKEYVKKLIGEYIK